jgi:hypothetical protein
MLAARRRTATLAHTMAAMLPAFSRVDTNTDLTKLLKGLACDELASL